MTPLSMPGNGIKNLLGQKHVGDDAQPRSNTEYRPHFQFLKTYDVEGSKSYVFKNQVKQLDLDEVARRDFAEIDTDNSGDIDIHEMRVFTTIGWM